MPKLQKESLFRKKSSSVVFYVALFYILSVFLFFGIATYILIGHFETSGQDYQEASTKRVIQLKKDELKISIDTKAALLNTIYLEKANFTKEKLKSRVLNTYTLAMKHHQKDAALKDRDVFTNHLIDMVSVFSWQDKSYLFLIDTNGKIHAHPDKNLTGKTRDHFPKDSLHNKFVENLFALSEENDEGFFESTFYKPGSTQPEDKLYYVKLLKPLDMYILVGEYKKNIKQEAYKELISIIKNDPEDPKSSFMALVEFHENGFRTVVSKNSIKDDFEIDELKDDAALAIDKLLEEDQQNGFFGSLRKGFIGYYASIPESSLVLYKLIPTRELQASINQQNTAIKQNTKEQLFDIIKIFTLFVFVMALITLTLGKFLQNIFEKSSKKIIEKNNFLNMLMNSIDDPIIVIDQDNKIIDINEAALGMCSKGKDSIIQKPVDDFERLSALIKDETDKIQNITVNDENYYFFCKKTDIFQNKDNKLTLIFCKNITDIKNLRESVREIFSNSTSPIVTITQEGYITFHNKAFLESFEIATSESEQTNINSIIRREFKKLFNSKLQKACESGFAEEFSIILSSKNSSSLHAKVSITKFTDQDYYIINIRDTTPEVMHTMNLERIVQEEIEKSQENELKFATIFQNAPAGIVVIDNENKIIQANKTFGKLSGYVKEDLIEHDFITLFEEESQLQILSYLNDSAKEQEDSSLSHEWHMHTKKGNLLYLNTFIKTIDLKNSLYRLIITSDITELKEIKEKEKRQELMLVQQSRFAVMGEMLNMIAHQWRQPLGALSIEVMNLIDTYEEGMESQYLYDWEKRSNKIISHLSKTIDEFRTFFKQDVKKDYFNIEDACLNSYNLIQPILRFSEIEVSLDLQAEGKVLGYHNRIQQAILNILNNAKDALTDSEQKEKHIYFASRIQDDNIIIEIEDNAGGIDIEPIGKIFEPYFSTKKKNSSGIGLYMTKTIIENQMEGSIKVSNSDKGACFKIQFPIDSSGKENQG